MDRFAIFVDAGYLYGEGGKVAVGTSSRSELYLDFEIVRERLVELGAEHSGLPHLRTYWYDAAPNGSPTPLHIRLAHERRLKLRLGQLTHTGQSGVDSRLIRDLIVLSHHQAIAAAYLLGGDEDLREGVEVAQEWGIPVTLMAVEPEAGETNLSQQLLRTVDDVITLDRETITEFLWRREEVEPVETDEAHAFGRKFAEDWLRGAEERIVDNVRGQHPRIPGGLDAELMESAENALGPAVREIQEVRHAVRGGFWAAVRPNAGSGRD